MDQSFWLERWQEDRTGFHRDAPMPLLIKHWPALKLSPGSRVLVPLAGKSLDMLWLAQQGCDVLGVELSARAVARFLEDNGLEARERESSIGRHFVVDSLPSGSIELLCGDVFDLDADTVANCAAVYDRAALIALPRGMRRRYAQLLSRILPASCRMLLVTLDYDQALMEGPPFAVSSEHVAELYGDSWAITCLETRDILDDEPKFAEHGLDRLTTSVYALSRGGND